MSYSPGRVIDAPGEIVGHFEYNGTVDVAPDLARRAVVMEDRARPHLTKIEGLWGTGTKGTRGGEKKPGSWCVFLAEHAPEVLPENVPVEETP